MLEALSKFVDILKATGWQTGIVAAFGCLFLYLSKAGVLPPLEPWMILTAWVVIFGFGALSAASLASATREGVHTIWAWLDRVRERRRAKKRFIDDIPTLAEHERRILGYLRHYKLRTFDSDMDGGYANTLLAKGYVRHVYGAKAVDETRVPTMVADHVWRIVNESPSDFTHQPVMSPEDRRTEVEPWRIDWMLR